MIASIIIISYNSAGHIGPCLEAVARLEPQGAYEVVVLDNGSTDNSVELVRDRFPDVQVVAESENWGFAGGVNRAVAQAQGEYILLMNPDALASPDWAAEILVALRESGGVVGSKVLEPDGSVQSLGTTLNKAALLTSHNTEENGDALIDVHAAHGAAMGFPKALWQQLGGFDEGFFPAYWEEVDFCERARQAGRRVVVTPRAVVVHAEASSTGKYSGEFYGYYLRNRLRYAAKWRDWDALWYTFRPAEYARLAAAPLLDRRVAKFVYDQGVPALGLPTEQERERIRVTGAALRSGQLLRTDYALIVDQLLEAKRNGVHSEVIFTSRFGALAMLRTLWNNVATRWYVRPNFDQQTRHNLAVERALGAWVEYEAARAAAQSLDVALLASKVNSGQ